MIAQHFDHVNPFFEKNTFSGLTWSIGFAILFSTEGVNGLEIYERIRLLRKKHLKMSQEKFGEMLGVNRSGINNIEGNRLVRPEQKEPLYKLICKTFDVSYEWLTTGDGDMFVRTIDDFVDRFAAETGISRYIEGLVRCYLKLDSEQRKVLDGVLASLGEMWANAPDDAESVSVVKAINMTIEQRQAESSNDATSEREAFLEMAGELFDKEKMRESQISSAKESDAG